MDAQPGPKRVSSLSAFQITETKEGGVMVEREIMLFIGKPKGRSKMIYYNNTSHTNA